MNKDIAKLIYNQEIVPFITYEAEIWDDSLDKKNYQNVHKETSEEISATNCKGCKTVRYEALFVLTGIAP